MKRLLIATDGSPAAESAVEAGVQLAAHVGAHVVFLHVVDAVKAVVPAFGPVAAVPVPVGGADDDPALAHAAEVAEARAVAHSLRLVAGFAVETILTTADRVCADLIVVGSNRHGALGTAYFGSVSKAVVRRSRLPVLVVHPAAVPVAPAAA